MGRALSLKGYASHRRALGLPGGTLRAVQEAVGAARIPMRADGTIDPAVADRAWVENTDHNRRPHSNGNGHAGTSSLAEQKRLESVERTRQLRLENDVREGRLLEVAVVERLWSRLVVESRTALLGVPSRVRMRCPDMLRAHVEVIDEEIRRCLEALADRGTTTEEERDAETTRPGAVHRRGAPNPQPLAGAMPSPAR